MKGVTVSGAEKTPEELADEDSRADVTAIAVIFSCLVLGALFFVSGWSF